MAMRRLGISAVGLALIGVTAVGPGGGSNAAGEGLPARTGAEAPLVLPDLVQRVPLDIGVEAVGPTSNRRFRLGFISAVANLGSGPLIVRGHRPAGVEGQMTADQLVRRSDGSLLRRRAVGRLAFVRSSDHRHWHYLDFDRYELRSASGAVRVRRDRKTGFCLGDRYPAAPAEERAPQAYTSRCGLERPDLRSVTQGISVGYGDDYAAQLEGQFVDVTGLPGGRYHLVHRANADRAVLEEDYGNNSASVLVRLSWPRGRDQPPSVRELRACDAECRRP